LLTRVDIGPSSPAGNGRIGRRVACGGELSKFESDAILTVMRSEYDSPVPACCNELFNEKEEMLMVSYSALNCSA
jgi:hypothetical protein